MSEHTIKGSSGESVPKPTEAQINQAAWAWRNEKDRETDASDDAYFRRMWRYLPGLGRYVEAELARAALSRAQSPQPEDEGTER